jgi:hypothetical protein
METKKQIYQEKDLNRRTVWTGRVSGFFRFRAGFPCFSPVHAHSGFAANSNRMQVRFPVQPVEPAGPIRFLQPYSLY